MKTWFLKLLGYKYKIIALNTNGRSEFWRCGVMKVPIDFNSSIEQTMPAPIFSCWDYDTIRVIYTKDPLNLNKSRETRACYIIYSKRRITHFFKTGQT